MPVGQVTKLYELFSNGLPHRTDEILRVVYGGDRLGLARVAARVYDVKKKYNVDIQGWPDKENPTLYWYQMRSKTNDELKKKYPALYQEKEEVSQLSML